MFCVRVFIFVIVLNVFGVVVIFSNPITTLEDDMTRQCTEYDLASTFNLTLENKIVAVYNSALCKRCMPKLLLFKALQLRFEIADFEDIMFILLTTEQSHTKQFADLQSKAGDVVVISLHDIENYFFVAGTFYVFDKCSRLTYELFPPWSELQYQLVKAAILSTLYDAPCGKCEQEIGIDKLNDLLFFEKELATTTTDSQGEQSSEENRTDVLSQDDDDSDDIYQLDFQSNDTSYELNMRAIIPLVHVHQMENNTYMKYNYVVFDSQTNSSSTASPDEHKHLYSDQTEILFDDAAPNTISSNKSRIPEYLHSSDGVRFKVTQRKPSGGNSTQDGIYQYLEVKEVPNFQVVTPATNLSKYENITNSINSSVVVKLRKWLSYRLISPFYNL